MFSKIKAWAGALALASVLMLGACSTAGEFDENVGVNEAGLSKSDQLADEKFVDANTPSERALRLCFGAAIVGEVWKYRLDEQPTTRENRDAALMAVSRMRDAAMDLRFEVDNIWFETEMFYAVKTLISAAGSGVKQRLLSRLAQFASGTYTPLTFLQGLKTFAGQTALTKVMMSDVRRFYADLDLSDPAREDAAWDACMERMDTNLDGMR